MTTNEIRESDVDAIEECFFDSICGEVELDTHYDGKKCREGIRRCLSSMVSLARQDEKRKWLNDCEYIPELEKKAYEKGKQAGRDEIRQLIADGGYPNVIDAQDVMARKQIEKIAALSKEKEALEAEIAGLKDQMDKEIAVELSETNKQNDKDYQVLLNNRNSLIGEENTRLRGALEKITCFDLGYGHIADAVEIAKKALEAAE